MPYVPTLIYEPCSFFWEPAGADSTLSRITPRALSETPGLMTERAPHLSREMTIPDDDPR